MGILAAATVGPWAPRGRAPRPKDFLPRFDRAAAEEPRQSPEEMLARLRLAGRAAARRQRKGPARGRPR